MSLNIVNIYKDKYREEYMVHTQDSISNDTECVGVIIKDESMDHLYFEEVDEEGITLEVEDLKGIYEFMEKIRKNG